MGHAILNPQNILKEADNLRQSIKTQLNKNVGVVIVDSRLTPTKRGTIGIAMGTAGVEALKDMRGHPDLFGKKLRVTQMAIADDLASAAQIIMGEADEATPIVIARSEGNYWRISNSRKKMTVPHEQCIYVKGLSSGIIYTKKTGWTTSKVDGGRHL
jgi:F420-0:gamma-glutamyl ligase